VLCVGDTIPARLELVSGRALVAHDIYLLNLYGNMLQLKVKLAKKVVSGLCSMRTKHNMEGSGDY